MEIRSIPEAFQTKLRIAVISALVTGEKTFKQLKEITGATDGNLGAQLNKLEELGYIIIKKEFINKKPQSTYILTKAGGDNFKQYVEMLSQILDKSQY